MEKEPMLDGQQRKVGYSKAGGLIRIIFYIDQESYKMMISLILFYDVNQVSNPLLYCCNY